MFSRVYTVTQLEQSLYLRSSGEVCARPEVEASSRREKKLRRGEFSLDEGTKAMCQRCSIGGSVVIRTPPLTVILRIIPATQRWNAFN